MIIEKKREKFNEQKFNLFHPLIKTHEKDKNNKHVKARKVLSIQYKRMSM